MSFSFPFLAIFIFQEQYVQCIWDKDTDEMVWWPPYIEQCSSKYNTDLHDNQDLENDPDLLLMVSMYTIIF